MKFHHSLNLYFPDGFWIVEQIFPSLLLLLPSPWETGGVLRISKAIFAAHRPYLKGPHTLGAHTLASPLIVSSLSALKWRSSLMTSLLPLSFFVTSHILEARKTETQALAEEARMSISGSHLIIFQLNSWQWLANHLKRVRQYCLALPVIVVCSKTPESETFLRMQH